jgi:hypothetical protein
MALVLERPLFEVTCEADVKRSGFAGHDIDVKGLHSGILAGRCFFWKRKRTDFSTPLRSARNDGMARHPERSHDLPSPRAKP